MRISNVLVLLGMLLLYSNERVLSQIDTTKTNQLDPISKKNTVFIEVGGNGFIYSMNYDRLIDLSQKIKLSTRIGVHYTHYFPLNYYRTIGVPVEISGLFSFHKSKHFFELGTGITYLNSYDRTINHTEDILLLAFRLGYRFQKPTGGLFVKIGFVPLYDWFVRNPNPTAPHHSWFLSGGLGVGYTF